MVRAKETRYQVPGWGVGELWTSDRTVLAHEFAFDTGAGIEPPRAERSQARPFEGAPRPPLGTVPGQRPRKANGSVSSRRRAVAEPAVDADELVARICDYLGGADVRFDDVPLDLGDCTPFQHAVASSLRAIPRGEVVSYGGARGARRLPGRGPRRRHLLRAKPPSPFSFPAIASSAADGIGGYGAAGVGGEASAARARGGHGLGA